MRTARYAKQRASEGVLIKSGLDGMGRDKDWGFDVCVKENERGKSWGNSAECGSVAKFRQGRHGSTSEKGERVSEKAEIREKNDSFRGGHGTV